MLDEKKKTSVCRVRQLNAELRIQFHQPTSVQNQDGANMATKRIRPMGHHLTLQHERYATDNIGDVSSITDLCLLLRQGGESQDNSQYSPFILSSLCFFSPFPATFLHELCRWEETNKNLAVQ